MSKRRPVPDFRFPSSGVAYHELYQGWVPLASIRETMVGLSPSAVPLGPNAATDATASECGAGALAEVGRALGVGVTEAAACRAGVGEVVLAAEATLFRPASPDVKTVDKAYPASKT
jgi:hypothetical protein